MRSLILASLMLVVPSTAALADDIALRAAKCWTLPIGTEDHSVATFDVDLDENGFVIDATVRDHEQQTPGSRLFVLSAVRALLACGPYESTSTSKQVLMNVADIPQGIDPFKE